MELWVKDPSTGLKSVSLTILIVSFTAVIVAGSLNMAGVVATTSLFTEIFYASTALYFGRKMTVNNKNFSADKAEEIKEKIE